MAKGCCGVVAGMLAIVFVYLLLRILIATLKINKMKGVKTTSLKDLLDMKDQLAQSPRYMELVGTVSCDEPIRTPYSRIETVFCDFSVKQYWTTPGGEDDIDHTKEVVKTRLTCPFYLEDGTEKVKVKLSEKIKANLETCNELEYHDTKPVEGMDIKYHKMPSNASYISYEYVENFLDVGSKLYFIGNVQYKDGIFHLTPATGVSFISDVFENKIIYDTMVDRAINIRWFLWVIAAFAIAFVGFYGKPAGLAEILRRIMDFLIEVAEEM